METRISKIIRDQKEQELYSDIHISFAAHPLSGKIKKVTNEESIVQGVKNRIRTIFGERLYTPEYGSYLESALFEPNDNFLKETIKDKIKNSLQNDERITIVTIDTEIQDLTINIKMKVLIKNNPNPISFNILIRRVR